MHPAFGGRDSLIQCALGQRYVGSRLPRCQAEVSDGCRSPPARNQRGSSPLCVHDAIYGIWSMSDRRTSAGWFRRQKDEPFGRCRPLPLTTFSARLNPVVRRFEEAISSSWDSPRAVPHALRELGTPPRGRRIPFSARARPRCGRCPPGGGPRVLLVQELRLRRGLCRNIASLCRRLGTGRCAHGAPDGHRRSSPEGHRGSSPPLFTTSDGPRTIQGRPVPRRVSHDLYQDIATVGSHRLPKLHRSRSDRPHAFGYLQNLSAQRGSRASRGRRSTQFQEIDFQASRIPGTTAETVSGGRRRGPHAPNHGDPQTTSSRGRCDGDPPHPGRPFLGDRGRALRPRD